MTKTLEGRIYAALLAAAQGETNLLDLASDLANGIKHQVHLELEMLEESAREREAVKLEIGVNVGITATKYEGMKGVIVAGNPTYWEVKINGISYPVHFKPEDLKPFPGDPDPQPAPTPAFAVGTRVRVRNGRSGGATGEITSTHDRIPNTVFVRFDDRDESDPRKDVSWPFLTEDLEPLHATAPALPEGVTLPDHLLGAVDRKERDGHTVYILGDEIRKREIGVKWPTKRAFPNMELFVNEGVGHTATITIHDDGLDYIIQMLQAIQAERNARKGAQS